MESGQNTAGNGYEEDRYEVTCLEVSSVVELGRCPVIPDVHNRQTLEDNRSENADSGEYQDDTEDRVYTTDDLVDREYGSDQVVNEDYRINYPCLRVCRQTGESEQLCCGDVSGVYTNTAPTSSSRTEPNTL